MSDTSDYTIIDDTSSSSSSSSAQVQALTPGSMSSPSPGTYKIMGHAINEIGEMLQTIRTSILTLYKAVIGHYQKYGYSEEYAKDGAAETADELVDMLESFGEAVALLPKEGHVETAELLVAILIEASAMLVADGENKPSDAYYAQSEALVYKCLAQAQLSASQSRYPAQAEMLQGPIVEAAIRDALNLHAFRSRDGTRLVADVLQALLPPYMRSLTAIYGSAAGVSLNYVKYAKSVLSELDRGKKGDKGKRDKGTQDETAEKTAKNASAESKTEDSGSSKNTKTTENLENKENRHNTAWYYWPWSGWQVRAWCSFFRR